MALFMDVHNIEGGVTADDVAGAHKADLATQQGRDVKYRALLGQRGGREDLLPRRGARRGSGELRASRCAWAGR